MSTRVSKIDPLRVSTVIGAFMIAAGGLGGICRAAGMLHTRLITTVLRFPMSFFDTTPKGRIISRFSKDIDTVDEQLRLLFVMLVFQLSTGLATIIAICISTWMFVAVAAVVVALFVALQVRKQQNHDDVIKWKHCHRCIPHTKGQWRGALMFTLISARINGWVNNRGASDLRRHRTHYDVTAMILNHYCPFEAEIQRCPVTPLNTLRPRQKGRHFAGDTSKRIFLKENGYN